MDDEEFWTRSFLAILKAEPRFIEDVANRADRALNEFRERFPDPFVEEEEE